MRIGVWIIGLTLLLGGYAALLQAARTSVAPVVLASEGYMTLVTGTPSAATPSEWSPFPMLLIEPPLPRPGPQSIAPPGSDEMTAPRSPGVASETRLEPPGTVLHVRVAPSGPVGLGESLGAEEISGPGRLVLALGGVALTAGLVLLGRRL